MLRRPVTKIVTGNTTLQPNTLYIADSSSQVVFTLPAQFMAGDQFMIVGKGIGGWLVQTNSLASSQVLWEGANQSPASSNSTITLAYSTNKWDCITLSAITNGTLVISSKNGVTGNFGVVAPATLHSYWKMDESSGGVANSKQTSGYDLTQVGSVGTTTGKLSGARGQFDDNNYFYVNRSNSNSTAYDTQTFLLDFWFKCSVTGAYQYLASKGWMIRINADNTLLFYADSTVFSYNIGSYLNGNWNHIAVGMNSSQARLYINGALMTSASNVGYNPQSVNLLFGRRPFSAGTGEYFQGYLDDFAFWSNIGSLGWTTIEAVIAQRWNAGAGKVYV